MSPRFQDLLDQYGSTADRKSHYLAEMRGMIAEFIDSNQALKPFADTITVVLHGSTVRNIDDAFSDIDCWIILDPAELARFDSLSDHRFLPFELAGKPGHMNPISTSEIDSCFTQVDLTLIHELRDAEIIVDRKNYFAGVQQVALQAMPDDVRHAFFYNNYVSMRSSHRALDNPLERHDEVASLVGITNTLVYAMRAALVLDKVPYPFDKWLYVVSCFHPTAQSLRPHIESILGEFKTNPDCLKGPGSSNPISHHLRAMREKLIQRAHETGIDELWLDKWWRYVDPARDAIHRVKWQTR